MEGFGFFLDRGRGRSKTSKLVFLSQGCIAMVPSMGEVLGIPRHITEFQCLTGNLDTGPAEAGEAAEQTSYGAPDGLLQQRTSQF